MSLVEIMSFEDAGEISFVKSVLQSENIFCHVVGDHYGRGAFPRLLVHRDELEQARKVLIAAGFDKRVYSEKRLGLPQ